MTRFKQATMAASVAVALGLPAAAYAVQGVHFDPDGGGAAGTEVVKTFDWTPGHVLYQNCFGTAGVGGANCNIYAQGSISSLMAPDASLVGIPAGVTYTFTLETNAVSSAPNPLGASPTVGDSIVFSNAVAPTGVFRIYVDSTPGAGDVNPLAGTGYTDGTPILTGTVSIVDYAIVVAGKASQTFDQSGGDNWAGLQTISISGTPTFQIEVTSIDSAYFKDPITLFTVDFTPDADQTDNSGSPFKQVDPSKSIVGQPFASGDVGSDGLVDIYCGKTAECSGQFQGDASTTFLTQVLPEPGMLALFGLGLGSLGAFVRRRRVSVNTAA